MRTAFDLVRVKAAKESGRDLGYWEEWPPIPLSDWQYEVANGDTRLSYWEFVAAGLGLLEV